MLYPPSQQALPGLHQLHRARLHTAPYTHIAVDLTHFFEQFALLFGRVLFDRLAQRATIRARHTAKATDRHVYCQYVSMTRQSTCLQQRTGDQQTRVVVASQKKAATRYV
jgi:hypothetical protein